VSRLRPSTQPTLAPLAHGALNNCFGCGLENRTGLRLKFFTDADNNVVSHLRLAARFAGPPGHAHGGIMSKSNRARGILAMTRHLEVDYLRPVPLGVPLTLTARHTGTTGRRNHIEAQLADASRQVLATGKAVFVTITPDLLAKVKARQTQA
jgi:acyl-coenzyme A thioesterase PaaI-like protein